MEKTVNKLISLIDLIEKDEQLETTADTGISKDQTRMVPINKGNYSMDTDSREALFDKKRGFGWESEYTEYRKKWSELAQNQIISDYPLLVDLELASVCNLRCPMCYTITDEFKKQINAKLMNWNLYTKIIDEIGGKVPAIRLSLRGEATLHKKFVECIRYAKSKNIKEVSTLTHGGKLNIDFFREISEAGMDWITVSIDGTGETYEKIRKPIKFDQIVNNLTEISDYKRQHGLVRPLIKVQGIWPAIKEDIDRYYNTFAPIADLVAFNPLIDYLSNDTDIDFVSGFMCPQQYQRLVIGADGTVMKCSNDEENREIIGNANFETVHELWHGPNMTRVREIQKEEQGFLKSPVCQKCYLPRSTSDEEAWVNGRKFIIRNYTKRNQCVGK